MSDTATTLPRWDTDIVYPGLDSPAYLSDRAAVVTDLDALAALFDEHGVDRRGHAPLDITLAAAFDEVFAALNALLVRFSTLRTYIYCHTTTNSRDDLAQAALSGLLRDQARLSQLMTRLTAWIGSLNVDALVQLSAMATTHQHWLARAHKEAQHQMSPAEEALAAELDLSGGGAWGRLHSNLTSQIRVPITLDGTPQQLPMSAIRNLAFNADRSVRAAAHDAEIAAWQAAALPLSAALNGVKGHVTTLAKRRGYDTPLDAALFANDIDQTVLDAMMTAAHESFPDFRHYMRAKAQLLGQQQLAWYDLFAPVGSSSRSWAWPDAEQFVVTQFARFSPRMSAFAARAFAERWVDAGPREGKVGGAFCARLRADESRILMNYEPTIDKVMTLAHELGHGYHNLNLSRQTMLNQQTPMTLAETASIFCETIIRHAAMDGANREEQIEILDASIQNACQVVVDISSRFLFEQSVFAARAERELSIDEFCNLMRDAQRATYGDAVDDATLHQYMWAVKGHYYSSGLSFYNYPYMFGLLFGLGLYAIYLRDPEPFLARYDELLGATGLADAVTLAEQMGFDLRSPDFWRGSLDIVRADINRFVALADGAASG